VVTSDCKPSVRVPPYFGFSTTGETGTVFVGSTAGETWVEVEVVVVVEAVEVVEVDVDAAWPQAAASRERAITPHTATHNLFFINVLLIFPDSDFSPSNSAQVLTGQAAFSVKMKKDILNR
jgi:hypothetical protein